MVGLTLIVTHTIARGIATVVGEGDDEGVAHEAFGIVPALHHEQGETLIGIGDAHGGAHTDGEGIMTRLAKGVDVELERIAWFPPFDGGGTVVIVDYRGPATRRHHESHKDTEPHDEDVTARGVL